MNRQESRYKARKKRERQVAKRKMLILLATILLITIGTVICGTIFSTVNANAEETVVGYKYYKSILIEEGDSLWSIAKEYQTEVYKSTQDYIDELVELNNLTSDEIQEGQYLMVPYYDTELK